MLRNQKAIKTCLSVLAEYGTCYRYEQSGELFGLMRVRCLHMNDAHIYCTKEQFYDEFKAVNDMYLKYFKIFGIDKYVMRLISCMILPNLEKNMLMNRNCGKKQKHW